MRTTSNVAGGHDPHNMMSTKGSSRESEWQHGSGRCHRELGPFSRVDRFMWRVGQVAPFQERFGRNRIGHGPAQGSRSLVQLGKPQMPSGHGEEKGHPLKPSGPSLKSKSAPKYLNCSRLVSKRATQRGSYVFFPITTLRGA